MAINAGLNGIKLKDVEVELEGHIDLPGFLGLAGLKGLQDLPGYHTVKAVVKVESDASKEAVKKVFNHVVKYSPVGLTLSKAVNVKTELEYK